QSSHRSSARLSRFPKSVACIIATSGRRPDPAQSVRHARARPSVRLLHRPTLSSAAFVRGSGWAQSGWLAFLRPVVYSLLTFLGPSALSQPWGKFGMRGRPAAARAADIRRLEELVDLMPRDALKTAVRRFLTTGSANATDVRALRRMLKWLPRSAVTGSVDLAAIKREVHAGLISPLLVEEEAEIAAQELIRHWFDSLRLAWEAWGERD